MTVNFAVFILGLFGIPIALLLYGHRLRKRGSRGRNAFWGAIIGHCIAGTIVIIGMMPPEQWTAEETARGFFGMWSLLLLPAAGALMAALKPAARR